MAFTLISRGALMALSQQAICLKCSESDQRTDMSPVRRKAKPRVVALRCSPPARAREASLRQVRNDGSQALACGCHSFCTTRSKHFRFRNSLGRQEPSCDKTYVTLNPLE